MLTFILRWFKGLILGWIMSILFFLIQRALSKAFGQASATPQSDTPSSPRGYDNNPSASSDIIETIWAGMTSAQLRSNFGPPKAIQRTDGGEIWIYSNLNGAHSETNVIIRDGIIQSWGASPPPSLST